ncbi:MAG: acetolactate synthase catalytic subunit [Desulfopila sp.]
MIKTESNAMRIAKSLKRHGVKEIFGQSNPYPIILACEKIGIRQIGFRQENTGTYMAHGYAMCSGSVSVVAAQNGPAAALVVAGLAESLKASIPIIAVVQDVAYSNTEKNAFQELDHVKLFEGVSKWVRRIPCHERIEDFVDMAFIAAASSRPGPAVLLCPTDMMIDQTEYPVDTTRVSNHNRLPLDRVGPDPEQVVKAAKILAQAKKPLIYSGGGVISSGAQKELRAIQEDCAIPVATTSMGKGGVDEKHPLSIGPIGYYMGKRGATKFLKSMVQGADVILLAGNRTNQNGTDVWTLLPRTARYIHIDIDPMEIGRNYETEIRVLGDAKLSLAALHKALLAEDLSTRRQTRSALEIAIKTGKEDHAQEASDVTEPDANPIQVERLLAEINRALDPDHIVVGDASFSSIWLANYVTATEKRKFVFPRGIAGIGWGLPMAIGAKLAQPKRRVICLTGDGGFAHAWSELETCKREKIDVVIVVINNRVLAYQKYYEVVLGGSSTSACDLGSVNHASIAEACGVMGIRVEKAEDLKVAIQEAMAHEGTVLIDVIASPACYPPIPMMDNLLR